MKNFKKARVFKDNVTSNNVEIRVDLINSLLENCNQVNGYFEMWRISCHL